MAKEQIDIIVKMASALRTAKRVLVNERRKQFESFTMPLSRSYDDMEIPERRAIERFDRAIAKINAALAGYWPSDFT